MTMLMDLAAFGEEGFDPKAWVNSSCSGRPADEPVEKHLSELEMKLQLLAEGIAAQLEEQSANALLRVPRAVREVNKVRDDGTSLRGTVGGILQRLEQVEGMSAQSVAALARVDIVKQRMEAARDTLQDAAGLAQLTSTVADVFASGDLPRVAETLAQMRRCLVVVGEVPEFSDVERQLNLLEDRLDSMVQPKLSEALLARNIEDSQRLRDILIAIGRYQSLEQQYTKVRLRPLKKVWEEFDSVRGVVGKAGGELGGVKSFGEWLPGFFDEVLLVLEQESKWCALTFPLEHHLLVSRLLMDVMATISSTFITRIDGACSDAESASADSAKLAILMTLHSITGVFARNVQHVLMGLEEDDTAKVLRAIFGPFEVHKNRYHALESLQLQFELSQIDLRPAAPRGLGARGVELSETVRRMEASVPALMVILEAAVERCINFTGGSEAEALLKTLDEVSLHYLSSLFDVLRSLRTVCGLQDPPSSEDLSRPPPDTPPEEEEWALVQGALQLLTVSESLSSRSSVFEASLRATLASLGGRLHLEEGGVRGGDLSAENLRLVDEPEKARRLGGIIEQAKDPRFHALPKSAARVESFQEAVHTLVFDVLIFKVKGRLANLPGLPVWNAPEEDNAFQLPSFSAYPQPYVTAIGEYLLTLPQQLDPLFVAQTEGEGEEAEEGQALATEWMLKVAEGAANIYSDQLRTIPMVSDRGAAQLAADIEYLCNVLSALSMGTPPVLATFQACMGASREKLQEMVKDPDTTIDLTTLKLVAKMRGVTTE